MCFLLGEIDFIQNNSVKSNYSAASVGSFHKNRYAGSRMKQGDKHRKELMLNRLIF